uniref:Uncharacterized protein n=1 Tax=Brugia malayi TaxID=6279 RepID=A8PY44_BRUMA
MFPPYSSFCTTSQCFSQSYRVSGLSTSFLRIHGVEISRQNSLRNKGSLHDTGRKPRGSGIVILLLAVISGGGAAYYWYG